MSIEENKQLIRSYLQVIDENQTSDWGILDEFLSADFIAHNPPLPGVSLDREGMKRTAEIFRLATPGRHEITLHIAEDDLVASYIVGKGIHSRELFGIPATSRDVQTDGMVVHRIVDGKITEYWSVTDVVRVLQQIGAMPVPPST